MNDNPTDNRIFTGSDKPFSAEQAGNLLKSPEFDLEQHKRIKAIADTAQTPQQMQQEHKKQLLLACELIKDFPDGDLLAIILKCRIVGYSHKKIAKTLMKSERDLPYFTSLGKAIKFVEEKEKEAFYKVRVALSKRSRVIIP